LVSEQITQWKQIVNIIIWQRFGKKVVKTTRICLIKLSDF
jgi:hypothetical protein